jgi:prepilin-type N-terminal cleavage/methylation domain-containing protein
MVTEMKGKEEGFTLVETLVALFLLAIGLLGIAPLFVLGTRGVASSADMGTVGARATERLEVLRATGFASLAAGGSLTTNVAGYYDATRPDVTVRWTVANNATPATLKTIVVRAVATRRVMGLQKEITVSTRRGQ